MIMKTTLSPLAGKPAPLSILVDVPRLITAYYAGVPDPRVPAQRVAFGTSGHRGSSLTLTFNEWHILAITQAICLYRAGAKPGRTVVPWPRHACAFRSGLRLGGGGAGGQWRPGDAGRRR